MSARHETGRHLVANLPVTITFFLCAVTVYVLICQLVPATQDLRRAKGALADQIRVHDELRADRDAMEQEHFSLANDPQAVERALDEKGVRPPAPRTER